MGPQEASGKPRLLVAMALASGITSVPSAAIVLALPTIHRHFDASLTELQWTVTGYLLAYSALLIAAGRLADVFGRVRMLTWGTVLYAAASIPAALAGSALVLILGLAAVGVGAAALTPASLAIVTDRFTGASRGVAVGVWGGATALFSGVGPAIGGVFTQEVSWRWILWLNVIVGVIILIGVRGTPESFDPQASRRIDYTGLALSAAGLGAITLALNEAPTPWPVGSSIFVLVLVAGALLLGAFTLVQRRIKSPLIDLAMFRRRNVTGAAIIVFVLDFAFGAVLFFVPLYLEELLGFDALKSGLLLLPASATMMIAMPVGGRLFERLGPVAPIVGGMTLAGVAMLLLGGISTSTHYSELWPPLALLGLGIGTALTPMNLAALGAMPPRNHGAVAAIITTLGGLGATFGVALSGAVFESLQTDRTVSQAAARGIHLTDSAAGTLDGLLAGTPSATKALDKLPPAQHSSITDAVHHAFTSALGATMRLSFVIVVAGIVLTLLLIRSERAVEPLPRPNMGDPFSGLAPRP
ncbi:MAG: MFS transporter [Solirubrobacteraceae bacterium]